MAYGDNLGHLRRPTGELSEGQSGGYHNIPQTPENASDSDVTRYSLREFDGKQLTPDPDHVKMMRTIATGKSLDPRGKIQSLKLPKRFQRICPFPLTIYL